MGRDEKGCLLSTEKKAVVDVDQLRTEVFYWSTSTTAFFNLVDVDLPFSKWSTSTCLFLTGQPAFFNLVDVLVDRRCSLTSIDTVDAVDVRFPAFFITPCECDNIVGRSFELLGLLDSPLQEQCLQ